MLRVKTIIKTSPIQGTGIFAAEKINQWQLVWKFDEGLEIEIEPKDMDPKTSKYDSMSIEYLRRYAYFDPLKKKYILVGDNNRFMNHSDNPNIGTFNGKEDTRDCYAQKDIEIGEELTEDYSTYGDEYWNAEVKKWKSMQKNK